MRWKPKTGGVDWLHAGFSERAGGVSAAYGGGALNLGWTAEDTAENVAENRRLWVTETWGEGRTGTAGLDGSPARLPELVTLAQVHSAESVVVRREMLPGVNAAGRTTLRGDGLMTVEPEVVLGIQTADCVPVLIADVRTRAVTAFHAGWRGTADGIVERGVVRMREVFGSRPEDLWAAIGPAVGACCYAVGEEVRERFGSRFRYAAELFTERTELPRWRRSTAPGTRSEGEGQATGWFLDLHESNRRQLASGGVPEDQIEVLPDCTACSVTPQGGLRFFSYRAEQGSTGRMMALIGVSRRG